MRRSDDDVASALQERGIFPGASVSWEGHQQRRYGCVLRLLPNATVEVQASNAAIPLPASALSPEPTISDPVREDYLNTYPNLRK